MNGQNYIVQVPDALFMNGDYVYAWVYAYGTKKEATYVVDNEEIVNVGTSEQDIEDRRKANSVFEVVIPVNRRPVPFIIPVGDAAIDLSDAGTYSFGAETESLIIGQH